MEVDPRLKSAVEKLKSGNAEGFNEIYGKTYNYVYFRAKQIMKNEDDAMDLLQTVYMEAYKSIGSLESPDSIYSWLSSITFRQGMKIFQKKKEILLDEDFESIFDSIETLDQDSRPESSLEKREQQKLLADLIDSLPEVQRATVVAFYYDNIKIEEIAEVMGCSVGTVKSRLSYARQALKKKLEKADAGFGKAGKGTMALTGAMIFGAVQIMSEETVLAAPAAMGAFTNICSGLGIAGGAFALGSGVMGGAGVSAAAGSAAASSAAATAGTAAVLTGGTAAAGSATAAAGSAATAAAAGTAAAETAAIGSAAAAAGGAAVTGGAAKGIAVAVAVAVAGTGGTVGTTIYRNTVSSSGTISGNEQPSDAVSDDFVEAIVTTPSEIEVPYVEELKDEIIPSETAEEPVSEEIPLPDDENVSGDRSETEEEDKESGEEQKSVSGDSVSMGSVKEDSGFDMPKKVKKHIAESVASVFITSGQNYMTGEVNNDMLEAAYIIEKSHIMEEEETHAHTWESAVLSNTRVLDVRKDGDVITVGGSFDVMRPLEGGGISARSYLFTLQGVQAGKKGSFGRFSSRSLSINAAAPEKIISENEAQKPANKEEEKSAPVNNEEINGDKISDNEALIPETAEIIHEEVSVEEEILSAESPMTVSENSGA